MCEICGMPGEEPEGSTCEEALANGVVTEYCSFCGRKEDCPFHLWLFDLKFGDFEMTIQMCFDCSDKDFETWEKLTKLRDEQESEFVNSCPIHIQNGKKQE